MLIKEYVKDNLTCKVFSDRVVLVYKCGQEKSNNLYY